MVYGMINLYPAFLLKLSQLGLLNGSKVLKNDVEINLNR